MHELDGASIRRSYDQSPPCLPHTHGALYHGPALTHADTRPVASVNVCGGLAAVAGGDVQGHAGDRCSGSRHTDCDTSSLLRTATGARAVIARVASLAFDPWRATF